MNCHSEQAGLWQDSDHSWAWLDATAETVLGNFGDQTFEHHGVTTRFLSDSDRYWIETKDEAGSLQNYQVKHVVGVKPLQQYLIEQPGGRLQVLDVAWDTERKTWFMVFPEQIDNLPGNALHWSGVYKNWNGRCATCHATNFQKNYDMRSQSFASTWSEKGVTCEACHGPGKAHVEWATSNDLSELKAYLGVSENGLVNAEPDTGREIGMCAGCHARRAMFSQVSPLPGTAFAENYELALLRPDLYHADGQIKDEVYVYGSFLQSKMYSAGVTCSNCHNPHSGKVITSDNSLCTQCHNPEGNPQFTTLQKKTYDGPEHHNHPVGSEGAACVSCHMPETTYMQIDPRRDHRFGIPDPHMSAAINAPDACTGCHAGKNSGWAIGVLAEWYPASREAKDSFAVVFARADTSPELASTVADLLSLAEDADLPAIIQASSLERLLPFGRELPWQRLTPFLSNESPFVRSATARLFQQSPPQVALASLVPLLSDATRSVRIAAARSLIFVPPGSFSADQRGPLNAALKEFHQSLIANADHPNTQMALAGLALSFRNIPAANAAIAEALSIDPQLTDAWIMKAQIENAQMRPDLVRQTMTAAQSAMPRSPQIFQFFGNYLASQRDYDGALASLAKAVGLSDGELVISTDYAAVLSQAGQYQKALNVLEALLSEYGPDQTVLFLKANAHLELNQISLSKRAVKDLLAINPDYPLPESMIE